MTMHPDPATPWQRPHRHPEAFARMVEPPRRRSAVWATLAREAAVTFLVYTAVGLMILAACGIAYALAAHVVWPAVTWILGGAA